MNFPFTLLANLQTSGMVWAWLIFITFVLGMLALDLGVFHRKSHTVGVRGNKRQPAASRCLTPLPHF